MALICMISVHISDVTPSVATTLDSLEIALYSIPAAISLLCTYLICHRILFSSSKNHQSRIGRNRKLFKIMEIIVESSLIYTVMLLCTAVLDVPIPRSGRSIKRETAYTYMSALLTPISVCNLCITGGQDG